MQSINFTTTRDPTQASILGLDFRWISNQDDIFYTSRIFFGKSEYFRKLLSTPLKENIENTLRLDLSTKTLEKYFAILSGETKISLEDEEVALLIELADLQQLKPAVSYLASIAIEREMIMAGDFLRLITDYDLFLPIDANHLIHLEDLTSCLDQIDESILWDCFDVACMEAVYYSLTQEESPISMEDYKKFALAFYDRFPDKAEMFREHTVKHLGYSNDKLPTRSALTIKLRSADLFSREEITDFRKELEECFDIVINHDVKNPLNFKRDE